MTAAKMHADEVETDVSLVRRLLAAQFPHWAGLPIRAVPSAGTDNALYRLGDDLLVRLPRIHWAVEQVDVEHEWLPRLAPRLPLTIPAPLDKGAPGAGYPWHWSVYRWLEGENPIPERLADACEAASDLAGFILALQRINPPGKPSPGLVNSNRGTPLVVWDTPVRAALDALRGLDLIDVGAAAAAWGEALQTPLWSGPSVWLHGDLQSGNLLATDGRLSAVIDFGCLSVGDPACDLQPAWNLFAGEAREIFRATTAVDEATWARGRGWSLAVGLVALPYYHETNPVLADIARRAIAAVLADHGRSATP